MRRISFTLLLAVLFIAGLVWFNPDLSRSLRGLAGTTVSTESHKCRQGGKVLYSTGKCPAGSVEEAITAGTINVVSMPKPAALPASAASLPTVRDLLVNPNEPSLQDKRIERVMNQ